MTNVIHIDDLPLETLVEILKNVDGCSLGKCRRVSKKWNEILNEMDHIWLEKCRNEFKYSSQIAKLKSGNDCTYYNIFRNLKLWANLSLHSKNVREFYKFNIHDKSHALDVNYGVLPLRDAKGTTLYDMTTLKYIPVVLPERNCLKIANNDIVTVIQLKYKILVQKTVNSPTYTSETSFKADNFVLTDDTLYFYNNRDVFKCDLLNHTLSSKLITSCDYDIKEMAYNNHVIYIFTDCGKVVSIRESSISVKPLNCPIEWIRQIKHICAVNDRNLICYSRNLFKIETDNYKHLYLEFPPITALFFYVDVVLIGTRSGEILLYRLSSQKRAIRPIFETVATLPDEKFALKLDVCERESGPVIIASTFLELYLIEFYFYPLEQGKKKSFTTSKLNMYKRLLKLKERLRNSDK